MAVRERPTRLAGISAKLTGTAARGIDPGSAPVNPEVGGHHQRSGTGSDCLQTAATWESRGPDGSGWGTRERRLPCGLGSRPFGHGDGEPPGRGLRKIQSRQDALVGPVERPCHPHPGRSLDRSGGAHCAATARVVWSMEGEHDDIPAETQRHAVAVLSYRRFLGILFFWALGFNVRSVNSLLMHLMCMKRTCPDTG